MLLDGCAPLPPFPPGYEPPGTVYQLFAAVLGVLLLAECATFLLPEPWRYAIFRAVFERVWPFSVVDVWICSQLDSQGKGTSFSKDAGKEVGRSRKQAGKEGDR